jgi:hypothetical protein
MIESIFNPAKNSVFPLQLKKIHCFFIADKEMYSVYNFKTNIKVLLRMLGLGVNAD